MSVEITRRDQQILISGTIGFANVVSVLNKLKAELTQLKTDSLINMQNVQHLDGAIVAMMISLLRHAKSLGIKIEYLQVPDHILRISKLYGVKNLLSFSEKG